MKKLSEIKGEKALDLLAEIIEPAAEIMSDPDVQELTEAENKATVVKHLIKEHKRSIIEILAVLDETPVEEYESKMNVFTLPAKILQLLNDPDLISFFTSQGQIEEQTSSTAPTESTEVAKK